MGVDEARERGFHSQWSWAELSGDWRAPIRWLGTNRETELRFTIEPTGRVLVLGLGPAASEGRAGARLPRGCRPVVLDELRVSLQTADGSLQGELEAVLAQAMEQQETYRKVTFWDPDVELRGNLELEIDEERRPSALQVTLDWLHLEGELEERVNLTLHVRYAQARGRTVVAEARPADGCSYDELPRDQGCVPISAPPQQRVGGEDAGAVPEPRVRERDAGSGPEQRVREGDAGSTIAPPPFSQPDAAAP